MKRLLALASSFPLVLVSALFFAAPANSVPSDEALAGVGDPIYGDDVPSSEKSGRGVSPATVYAGLTNEMTWTPAITTGAATAAFIDESLGTVYQASRSASPARLFTNSMADGSSLAATELPDTTGSWDMTLADDLLAVGTNGNGVSRPRLVMYKLDESGVQDEPLWNAQLPASSSVSAYVMAVVADASDSELFWVGTYDPKGARLYSFDSRSGDFREYTPGSMWSERGLKYVRALTSTPQGLFIGMGNPGYVWQLGVEDKFPFQLEDALGGAEVSTVYTLASTRIPSGEESVHADVTAGTEPNEPEEPQEPTEPLPTLVVAGTDSPASIHVFAEDVANRVAYTFNTGNTAVDRVTVDENRTAWFTVRPSSDLYSLDLDDVMADPVLRSQTVRGAETRAISAKDGVVRGITGMREMWTFDIGSGEMTQVSLDRGGESESSDTASQGVLAGPGYTLVGGHWRLQTNTLLDSFDIGLPGEPKAQVLVEDTVYTAIYPHASVFSVDVEQQAATFVARAEGQTRPRALTWNPQTQRLYMGTSNAYGKYGGKLSIIDPETGASQDYETPVKDQMPFALAPIGTDLLVGTSPAGEAVGVPEGSRSSVVRWNPKAPDKPVWTTTMPTASAVTGVTVIKDGAGEFVFAITADGKALALDGNTGAVLWQEALTGAGNALRNVDNYVLVLSGTDIVEYFPSRSTLTQGLTLTGDVRWMDFQEEADKTLAVATVTTGSKSSTRGFITTPRQVNREQGANRYTTAIAISQSTFSTSNYAVLATGNDFPDALTAGPLAGLRNAPVLLNNGTGVRADVGAELKRLGVKTVYVAGGSGVIPKSVEDSLRNGGYTVKRLSGADRYQTAVAISEEIRVIKGTDKIPMVLTTGLVFPDALSATPAVVQMGGAIILTRESSVDARTSEYVRGRASKVATVGGLAQVAAAKIGVSPQWTATGKDRFETSALVAQQVFPSSSSAFLATGFDYPDGLAAGPAAAQVNAPVLLSHSDALPKAVVSALTKADKVTLVGGTGVLQTGLAAKVRDLN